MKNPILPTLAVLGLTGLTLGHAIDFEKSENYEAEQTLVGQPAGADIRWKGTTTLCEVVAGEGVDGGQAIRMSTPGDYATVYIEPEDLGISTADDGSLRGKVAFSFAVKTTGTDDGSFEVPLRVRLGLQGDANAVRIHCYAGGKIEVFDGTKPVRVKDDDGTDLALRQGVYTTVSGEMDFAAGTYTIRVNDVEQKGRNGATLAFNDSAPRTGFGRVELTNSSPVDFDVFIDQLTVQAAQ